MQTLSDQQNCLLSILTCLICQQKASQAHICPNCSKFFCLTCITTWINDKSNKCPYCTQQLNENQLINCQKLSVDLSNAIETIKIAKTKNQKKCEIHNLSLNYYCKDCQTQVCSDCCIILSEHQNHVFIKTAQAKKEFQKQNTELKLLILKSKQEIQKTIKFHRQNPNYYESKIQKDNKKLLQFIKNLKQRTNKKFISQILQIQKIIQTQQVLINQKNQLYDKSLSFIKDCSKIQFVATDAQQLQTKLKTNLDQIKQSNKHLKHQLHKHQHKHLQCQVLPRYQEKMFSLLHYGQLCYQNQMIYTDILKTNGLQWRLKIYPAGHHSDQKPCKQNSQSHLFTNIYESYLSVFVQLKSSFRQKGRYRHKVIIEHPKNKTKNIQKQFESEFDSGQCWGYDKYVKIGYLYDHGFIDDKNQELKIILMIAPANYYEATQDLKLFIKKRKQYLQQIIQQKPVKVPSIIQMLPQIQLNETKQ